MKICYVTSEFTPYAKVGGLADVSNALPSSLAQAGHELNIILPFYKDLKVDHSLIHPIADLQDIAIDTGPDRLIIHGYRCPFPKTQDPSHAPNLILVRCDSLFERDGIYGNTSDEYLRFLVLSRAAIEFCQRLGWTPDIFHCNDWQSALIPLLLRSVYEWDKMFSQSRTILTIHNIGHQGVFPSVIARHLNLHGYEHLLHQADLQHGKVNYMKTGVLFADALTTVSPTYAREIQTSEYGVGLEELLSKRRDNLHGILNGIDPSEWNPQTDPLLAANYSINNLKPKLKNKQRLLENMKVDVNLQSPTLGIVSRLASQKGFDLMFDVFPELLRTRDVRLVVLGSGEQRYIDFFTNLRQMFPDKVGFYHGFSNEIAHLIEAGSDMFVMPSQYEPCGLNQMYSQAYGTVPIVRKTGGLADTVSQFDPNTGNGTGFVFEHFTADGLRWATHFALDVFSSPKHWNKVVVNGMQQDFSWTAQAQQYLELYKKTLSRPKL